MPHPAAWVGDIALVAWDKVDVQVGNGLTGGGTDVDPDVVAMGLECDSMTDLAISNASVSA